MVTLEFGHGGVGPFATADYGFPLFPTLAAVAGVGVLVFFLVQALLGRAAPARPGRVREPARTLPAAPVPITAPPPPPPPQYKRAPVSIQFRNIPPDYPDVWGPNEPLDVVFRLEDNEMVGFREIPGLTILIEGRPIPVQFNRGVSTVRYTFRTLGEKPIQAELSVKGEALPRRTRRVVKIVDYRTEIADVFANFREEASRAIVPIHQDATPWEIYDLLTGTNSRLPSDVLRDIVVCFEEAKFSNHAVNRATYERMISAILALERVEL